MQAGEIATTYGCLNPYNSTVLNTRSIGDDVHVETPQLSCQTTQDRILTDRVRTCMQARRAIVNESRILENY